eukprot:TRINITY_DN10556_c0_g1_i1.p1 TRINITY_DN10556_c0_g1~~TRINITY_DN10556_c0_g1_i1.p1  ORF type:complete len:159 (-),score=37.14 TRINITY_DN10556_c0_g1_i1:11-487(-)
MLAEVSFERKEGKSLWFFEGLVWTLLGIKFDIMVPENFCLLKTMFQINDEKNKNLHLIIDLFSKILAYDGEETTFLFLSENKEEFRSFFSKDIQIYEKDGVISNIWRTEVQKISQNTPIERIDEKVQEIATILDSCSCLLYTSPSPRDRQKSRMPSSA